MKIDSPQMPPRPTAPDSKEAGNRIQRAAAPAQGSASSTISHLSSAASKDASQDVDSARVAEIRQAIREGRLQINAERIADGLIASVREQLARD